MSFSESDSEDDDEESRIEMMNLVAFITNIEETIALDESDTDGDE